jgi:opacity protein-like surface antigen
MRFLATVLLSFALFATMAHAAVAAPVTLKPVKVSEHAWYVEGLAGVASTANQGFNSNAGRPGAVLG